MKVTRQLTDETKQTITAAANEFDVVAKKLGHEELVADLPDMLDRLNRGIFRLVVMGEIKKGKSSFINALLNIGNLLPTDIDIATSTVYKIIHGPERKVKVFFLPDRETGRQTDPNEITESEVPKYGTEAGNPGNRERVEFIAVELPSELLATGLTIVDTPGVGGLYKSHRGISWRYAPNADAVFFILDSTEAVISQDEIDFLRELTDKITRRVYFVQTKTDMASGEQREAWEARNREILTRELPALSKDTLRYFPTSSKLKREGEERKMTKLVEDSGFPVVENFLRDELIAAKDFYLCLEIAKRLLAKFGVLRDSLNGEARAAQVQTGQELDALKKELERHQKDLSDWEQGIFQSQQQEFSDRFRDLKQQACEDLQNILDPQSTDIAIILDQLRQMPNATGAVLDSKIRDIQSDFIATCSEKGQAVIGEFSAGVDNALAKFCSAVGAKIPINHLVARSGTLDLRSWAEGVPVQQTLRVSRFGFDTARNVIGGGMMGFGITATVLNILTGGFLLLPALIVGGAFAGAAAGAAAKRQFEEALAKTERILRETMISVRNKALQDFTRVANERERAVRDLVKAAIKGTRDQYEREIVQIRERGNQTQEALRESATERAAVLKTIHEHTCKLEQIIQVSVAG